MVVPVASGPRNTDKLIVLSLIFFFFLNRKIFFAVNENYFKISLFFIVTSLNGSEPLGAEEERPFRVTKEKKNINIMDILSERD